MAPGRSLHVAEGCPAVVENDLPSVTGSLKEPPDEGGPEVMTEPTPETDNRTEVADIGPKGDIEVPYGHRVSPRILRNPVLRRGTHIPPHDQSTLAQPLRYLPHRSHHD